MDTTEWVSLLHIVTLALALYCSFSPLGISAPHKR